MTETLKVISPVDNRVYAERNFATDHEIKMALAAAVNAQKEWLQSSLVERRSICFKAVEKLDEQKQLMGEELSWQMGRPICYWPGEINGFAERVRYMAGIAEKKLADLQVTKQKGFTRFIKRVPVGVVFSIVPWNYPYLTAVNSIIPAIMAGNVVLMKPSSQTPLTAERIAKAFASAGLPAGVFQTLFLNHKATTKIIQSHDVNYVAFTGSVLGGRAIEKAAAGHFIDVGLELGGKDPAYVCADANMNHAVENLVDGAFFNSGQSCCGIERIYVHETVYKNFVEAFIDLVQQYRLGDPLKNETTLGPMARSQAADLVRHHIHDAEKKGAKLCVDVDKFDADQQGTPYMAPQVLLNVDHSMQVMQDESFGPVVGIMQVSSDEQAVELMNDSKFGLTASVWTQDESRAIEIGSKVQTGTLFMNRCDYLDPALAWTGVKNSGKGCTLSELGYEKLTRPKSFNLCTHIG